MDRKRFGARVSRRRLLQWSAAASALAATNSLLAACGDDDDEDQGAATTEVAETATDQTPVGAATTPATNGTTAAVSSPATTSAAASPATTASGQGQTASGPIVIGGWGGRFTESTRRFFAEPFMEETGIEVQIVDAPGEQVARLLAQRESGNIQWDMIDALGAAEAHAAFAQDLAAPLPPELKAKLESMVNLVNDYGFAFSSLAFVIACNADAAQACPTTPQEFWNVEQFPGPRGLNGLSPLQELTFALLADGVPEDQLYPMDLNRAFAKLNEIKPEVAVWYQSGDQMEQILRDEEVVMEHAWSGRAYNVMEQGVNLEISWEQGIYDPGFWFVVNGAPHAPAAFQFLEWIAANPEAQANWSSEMGYGFANPQAVEYMEEDVARRLAEHPDNFEKLVIPDWNWYAENRDEIERRWTEFLAG